MKTIFRNISVAVVLSAALWLTSSCGGDDDPILNPEPTPVISDNPYLKRIETPKMEDGNRFIQHSTKFGNDSVMTYCLEYNPKKFHTRWVAFRFDATTRQKNTSRSEEPFQDDPSLPASQRIGSSGFAKNYKNVAGIQQTANFDRGHICASADRVFSEEANQQTFYMTNMSPQLSVFNQHYWTAYETVVRNLGRNASFADTLYVVKGGTIDKVNGSQEGTMGTIQRTNGLMTIPGYYFMALLALKNGQYKALGFLMEHKDYKYRNQGSDVPEDELRDHVVTIDDLEKFTGIDFFHNLPDNIENAVEASVNPADWNL